MGIILDTLDVFLERMLIIVRGEESRPFCFRDFLSFELNGIPYKYSHGTIRNVFSTLRKHGKIEKAYKSIPTFYTLKGIRFGKSMTPNHTEDSLNYSHRHFFQWLKGLPVNKEEVHDINLGFKSKAIWNIANKSNSNLIENKMKDITKT